MATFQGIDYFDVDTLLSEEERMVRDTVREWVDDNLMPIIEEAYIGRRFPKEIIPQLAELGVYGANLPEEYGCAGLNNVAYGLMMQELERGDSGIRSFASVQGALDDTKSIRGFIVPTDAPGFTAKDQKGKLSLLASDTSELVLEDVRVGPEALLPESGGIKSPLMCLTQARYGISFGVVGAAMACFDEALHYAKERVMFDTVIGAKQIQQVRLADMLTKITQGQLLCVQLGRLKDAGTMRPQQVSLAKRANCDMAAEVAREARRLLGANGILVEYSAMRHMANLESVYTYEGTHDVHGLILGHDLTGHAAY
jgi:alkylation response protein AidB-like acyl-CoA dehydrogenase